MRTLRPGIWREKRKLWKIRNTHVGPGMWQETVRNVETRNTQCRTCIIARKRKKLQNETQTLYDLEYGQKQSKT